LPNKYYTNKYYTNKIHTQQQTKRTSRSHVCWHVYGLLHRSEQDYNEAIKAYKQALKVDPQNLQILRDLSMLQIQLRDTTGFAATRNTLLALKPNAKVNWMAFALARHMAGDLHGAIHVIDIYLGTLTEDASDLQRTYESSELAMYKNSVIAEIPDNYVAAIDHLTSCEHIVMDRGAWLLKRLEYQLKLQDYINAQYTIYQLFDRGMTEDHTIHSLLMCQILQMDTTIIDEVLKLRGTQTLATFVPLTDEQKQLVIDVYRNDLQNQYPRSYAIQRIPITLMEEEEFLHHIDIRCQHDLRRGVPSLCGELKSYLWTLHETKNRYIRTIDPVDIVVHTKYQMFVRLVDSYIQNLESHSKFTSNNNKNGKDDGDDDDEEQPSTMFWAWYLRAGLCEMVGQYVDGLQYIEKCIQHTPTAVDVYEMKALLLKQCGNIRTAVQCLDYGRELDGADRYMNNQTTRYMLQANMDSEALQRITMFTKHEGNAKQKIYEMQSSWYELELAACYARKGEYGKSLKQYHAVVKHFHDFQEDQFDFHSYCLRKVTLRSYISMLRYEDVIYGQEFYSTAAVGTARIYLHLYDVPSSNETEEPDYAKMDATERKKAKALARKKKKASERKETTPGTSSVVTNTNDNDGATTASPEGTATANNTKANTTKTKGTGANVFVDEDPLGYEYLKKNPLEEAKKYTQMLTNYVPQSIQAWILQYDVSVRRKKALLALQALHKAQQIDATNAEVFTRIVDFLKNIDVYCNCGTTSGSGDDNTPSSSGVGFVRSVLATEVPILVNHVTVEEYIWNAAKQIQEHPNTDLPMRIAVVQALIGTPTCNCTVVDAVQYIVTYGGMQQARMVSYETCRTALEVLRSLGDDALDAVLQWEQECTVRYPIIQVEEKEEDVIKEVPLKQLT
jgi:N-alpha-acetyltransferase 15/16, NatA auxiliary subunit